MAVLTLLSPSKFLPFPKPKQTQLSSVTKSPNFISAVFHPIPIDFNNQKTVTTLLGVAGLALIAISGPASAAEQAAVVSSSVQFAEPANALSLPTWTIHVSSVVEWVIAMALVWQYGEKSGYESWKGLSWGMVPLLGGAFCACTWHFFYNSESLEVLVALQAALTVIGNATMCIAAFRIYKSSQESSKSL
nr:ycf49-like protein [Ipomoea batatas]